MSSNRKCCFYLFSVDAWVNCFRIPDKHKAWEHQVVDANIAVVTSKGTDTTTPERHTQRISNRRPTCHAWAQIATHQSSTARPTAILIKTLCNPSSGKCTTI